MKSPQEYLNIKDDLEFACTIISDFWPRDKLWSYRRSLLSQRNRPERFQHEFTLVDTGPAFRKVDVPMDEFLMALDLVIRSNED